jgi:antirestriction protein ArdC
MAEPKLDVYAIVTERIIAAIESGDVAPWHKPWIAEGQTPRNAISGKVYRGANLWVLGSLGFTDPRFLTFNQAKALGGSVRKGEKGCPVVFWKFLDGRKKEGEDEQQAPTRRIPFLRYYTVFNVLQVEGLKIKPWEAPAPRNGGQRIEAAEALIAGYTTCPEIQHGHAQAAYAPALDLVRMPDMAAFVSEDAYYATKFHELIHSTGHGKRLARAGIVDFDRFGSDKYADEELIAEMGAAMLCALCGIDSQHDQSAAYLNSWLTRFKSDTRLLVKASGAAQKAVDYIRGESAREESEETEAAAASA